MSIYFFFFFFQAEDGIRDLTVTGVQTCALPILSPVSALAGRRITGRSHPMTAGTCTTADSSTRKGRRMRSRAASPATASRQASGTDDGPPLDRKSTRLNSSHSQISYADFVFQKTDHALS